MEFMLLFLLASATVGAFVKGRVVSATLVAVLSAGLASVLWLTGKV